MQCPCNELTEADGREAENYARGHLHSEVLRTDAFEEELTWPDTGRRFRLDYPGRTQTDPERARLRRI